ncbi:Histidinol dehydrogenase [uncultured Desulfatiglans sp.]|uniref:Histidinol dehydrogenase n=1 Tax=Uncultured Desulfatiglans sp. TaxID=1748965 RepID=A0A653A9S4_UNCDX|nr:Histidinol dehydrogenase [uncultured Desulfatiglans sp.]
MMITPKPLASLGPEERAAILDRSMADISAVYEDMRKIVEDVRNRGDEALVDMSREFEPDVRPGDLEAAPAEIDAAVAKVAPSVMEALRAAAANITRFHEAQREREMWSTYVAEGILAGRITRPIERVGCYIPGGRAAYPSTTLMTIIPARVAGVEEIIATTPAGPGMQVNPVTLAAARLAGCRRIFKIGGPWGIAAMAYGTASVPRVDKIVGPGNKYVTAAKMLVYGRVDIDSPAGPSEALILADETADPELVAVDLLSQLEHDPDSAALLVTPSASLAENVAKAVEAAFDDLPRKEIIEVSIRRNGRILTTASIGEAVAFANEYAPEHLQIMTRDPFLTLQGIRHAGSIFLGNYAPVPVGDYASGTNHVLPTGQCARMFSGLSVDDFIKKPTFQYLSKEGLAGLKETVVTLAEAEGLPLHARTVRARFEDRS